MAPAQDQEDSASPRPWRRPRDITFHDEIIAAASSPQLVNESSQSNRRHRRGKSVPLGQPVSSLSSSRRTSYYGEDEYEENEDEDKKGKVSIPERWTAEQEVRLVYVKAEMWRLQKSWSAEQDIFVKECEELEEKKRQYKKFLKRRQRDQKREGFRFKSRSATTSAATSAAASQVTSEAEDEDDDDEAGPRRNSRLLRRMSTARTESDCESLNNEPLDGITSLATTNAATTYPTNSQRKRLASLPILPRPGLMQSKPQVQPPPRGSFPSMLLLRRQGSKGPSEEDSTDAESSSSASLASRLLRRVSTSRSASGTENTSESESSRSAPARNSFVGRILRRNTLSTLPYTKKDKPPS